MAVDSLGCTTNHQPRHTNRMRCVKRLRCLLRSLCCLHYCPRCPCDPIDQGTQTEWGDDVNNDTPPTTPVVVTILLRAGGTVDDPLIVDSGGSSPVPHAQPSQPKKHIAIQTPAQPWLQMIKRIAALAAALFLCWAVLPAPPPPPPPRPRAPAGGTYGPLIAAGDAAVLSAQGVLRLCKEE